MSKKQTSNKDLKQANVATQTNNETTAPVAAQEPQTIETTAPAETAPADFKHLDLFPVLENGMKFEVNGYKVAITGKEYLKELNFPFTAWDATVTAPDGTTKDFQKVRNTAIRNYCHATSGITHNGGSQTITKVLSDEELAKEATRRHDQISGMMQRAAELAAKYGTTIETPEANRYAAIYDALKADNDQRREQADKAKAANKAREQRKEARDLTKRINELIASGNWEEAGRLIAEQNAKAEAQKAKETATDSDEATEATDNTNN